MRVGVRRVADEVGSFERVGRQVVELVGVDRGVHELEVTPAEHHDRRDRALGEVLGARRSRVVRLASQQREQALPSSLADDTGQVAVAGEPDQRRQQVHRATRRRDATRGEPAGRGDHQRHPGRALVEAHLVPEAALAEHVAVVAGQR